MESCVYLDNAATSWPKPPEVARAMADFLDRGAGNPGRGGHRLARLAQEPVDEVRTQLARMIHAPCADRVVMTHGCTDSVNMAIHGVIRGLLRRTPCRTPAVVTSCAEHNAVLRTLHCYAKSDVIDLTVIDVDAEGAVDAEEFLAACTERTALACLTHASNVLGTLQPVREVGHGLRERAPDALLLVDAAQTVGHMPVDVEAEAIDLLAIAGHKGLLGPTGTGALYVGPRAFPDEACASRLFCDRRGGTGAVARGLEMPETLPDALEAGTCNAVGFAGLAAGMAHAPADRHEREHRAVARLLEGLREIEGVTLYGRPTAEDRLPTVLFNLKGRLARDVGALMDHEYNICVRGGTHCAPLLHQHLGLGEAGGVRVSPGWATTEEDIERCLEAVRAVALTPVVS
ncbi:MAG: aminotransferase class V-fold PLP-dependent enzyme [Planctomycetota bacterium]